MSAAARQFCREVLENCHEPKAVEAWLRRRVGKKLRNRWEAMDPNARCVIMEVNPDRTFPLCSAPIDIFDSRHNRQKYPHREGRVEIPTVVEAYLRRLRQVRKALWLITLLSMRTSSATTWHGVF
jgi:hypothetical protein